jgi:putative inorganic carbon (HCO3(-)) transporter
MHVLAVAPAVQGAALLAAAVATAAALVATAPRTRAWSMLAAGAFCCLAVATLESGAIRRHLAELAAAGVAGGIAVLILALLTLRHRTLLGLLAVLALPFRVPVPLGSETASLLVPLYGVIAAGVLAEAIRRLRRGAAADARISEETEPDRWLRRLEIVFAVVLVLYGLQSLYSTDVGQALKNMCLFYVPFALLFRLLIDVSWTVRLLQRCFALVTGLALLFAAVGFYEYATGRLLLSNAKVQQANDLKAYFRVNSLFFDPNIYGRFLALTMILLAATLLWATRRQTIVLVAAALAVLWAGLVLSLSQSSFAALLAGLAILAALRWKVWPVVAVAAVGCAAAVALVVFAPGALDIKTGSEKSLDKATSGRAGLIRGAVEMARDRPVWGFGAGSFAERYRVREDIRSAQVAAISHTIPLTVAAEQGVIGLAAYLALLWAMLGLLFDGIRDRLRRAPPGIAAMAPPAVAAAFCALVLHTLVYAAFLEDPLTWVLLAIGAGLRPARAEWFRASPRAAREGVPTVAAPTL